METGRISAARPSRWRLETFLVEWKRLIAHRHPLHPACLETFLVEWKRRYHRERRSGGPDLETFLVEWKRSTCFESEVFTSSLKPS